MHPFQFAERRVSLDILQCVLLATDELMSTECSNQDMLYTQCAYKVFCEADLLRKGDTYRFQKKCCDYH